MTKEELKEYCDTEFKNIDMAIKELSSLLKPDNSEYSLIERAAISTFIVNTYSAFENILKQILMFDKLDLKDSSVWHEELLKKAAELAILPQDLYQIFTSYLSFRNSFVYTHISNINLEELTVLARTIAEVIKRFKSEVEEYIQTI